MIGFNSQYFHIEETFVNFDTKKCVLKIASWQTQSDKDNDTNRLATAMCVVNFVNWDYSQLESMAVAVFNDWIPFVKEDIDLMLLPDPVFNLQEAIQDKLAELNFDYNTANTSTFTYLGVVYNADAIAQNNINSTANYINKFNSFPPNFPMAWLADDGTILPLPNVAAFWDLYQAYVNQGVYNINRFATLKAQVLALPSTATQADLDEIVW